MWLSLMCTSNRVVELNHCPLLECRCHTTASEGHATGCSSGSRPCSLLGAWVTTLLERWCVSSLGLNVSICSLWWCRRMSHRFTCASTGTTTVHECQHVSCLDPAFQFEVVSSHHVHWRCLLGVSMAIHSKSRGKHTCSSAQLPTNTCATYRTLDWRNRSLCWIHAIFIFIHRDATIPGVGVLGGSQDLAG